MTKTAIRKTVSYAPTILVRIILSVAAALVGLVFAWSDFVTVQHPNAGNLFFTFAMWAVLAYIVFYAIAATVQRSRVKKNAVVVQKKRK